MTNTSKLANNPDWVETDGSCNQYYKEIIKDRIYDFVEDRVINPVTLETEVFECRMNIDNYTTEEIIQACDTFGYEVEEVQQWVESKENIPLILECLFELEN